VILAGISTGTLVTILIVLGILALILVILGYVRRP
jgi:hypothetical protein